ncbi:hypothetical protein HF521_020881 [Silurus meridionalis]|uniref:Ig-like domain-containing protein n=1 Tax=Silurus meridionalis TaxID=175797 RepID=A0A8T0BF19_SILME|nr:hypothetical protein HF521_020881 [Silurus meridionalis]
MESPSDLSSVPAEYHDLGTAFSKASSGTYTIEVFDVKGTSKTAYSKSICVYAKVPKPRVSITCLERNVDVRCVVEIDNDQRSGISYSWNKNGKQFKNVLNFSTSIEDKSTFICTVFNPLHNNTSDPVQAACIKPATLLGFFFEILVGTLGSGLIIILIVVVTVACCVARKKKEQERMMARFCSINNSPAPESQKLYQIIRRPLPPLP